MTMKGNAMNTASQRIPVLVSAAEKGRIAAMAKASGLSMGEFLRRAATAFQPEEDEKMFEGMISQMHKTTLAASAAIDRAIAYVDASNKRIAAMERKAR